VHADQYTVAGQSHIALEGVGAVIDRAPVSGKRVLCFVGGRTAVGDDLGPGRHVSMLTRDGDRRTAVS